MLEEKQNSELIGRPYRDKKVEVDLIVELDDGTKVNIDYTIKTQMKN